VLDIRVLGSVEAEIHGADVNLGPRQQRLVLGLLALEAGRLVSVDRLVELIWPVSAPRTAEHAVRVCVSRLRAALSAAGAGAEDASIIAKGPGYLLRTDPARIDAHRFQKLIDRARGAEDATAVALLEDALGLWRGPALADAAEEVRARLCAGLEESRLAAAEDRLDALLRLGSHRQALGELTALARARPDRERVIELLMLALHRGGRTSQALDTYRETRARLREELGIEPGERLRNLELRILREDPALCPPETQAAPTPDTAPVRAPALLPPGIADFTGRDAHLRWLSEMIPQGSAAMPIAVIAGSAGVGKTALAVRWAHSVRDRFPDGQLYIDLRGCTLDAPVRPEQALAHFLRATGVPPGQVPVDAAEAAGMFRSLLADKRMLVLLDDACSAEQVRPLLPASSGCQVVITSRNRLDGLVARDSARRATLEVLSLPEALTLLGRMLGEDRVAAEPEAAAELARTCALLPLALRIAAAQLSGQPGRLIRDHLAELRRGDLLAKLENAGDTEAAVGAAFELSYTALEPAVRRLFGLIGLVPGPEVTAEAAAALAGCDADDAARLLDRLAAAHLVDHAAPGRYTMHDLLRRYAAERALKTQDEHTRQLATERLLAYYLSSALVAADLLYPYMLRLPALAQAAAVHAASLSDRSAALAWLDAERPNLVAAVHAAAGHAAHREAAWLLADALRGYFYLRRHVPEWLAVAHAALAAAEAEHHTQALAAAHFSLGTAHMSRNQYPESFEHYGIARELSRASGWLLGEASVLVNLGVIEEDLGNLDAAADAVGEALPLIRKAGARHVEATALANLGAARETAGHLDEAAAYYRQASEINREVGDRHGEADDFYCLASTGWLRGELAEALANCMRSLTFYREIGARNDEAQSLALAADIHRDAGRLGQALEAACTSLDLSIQTGEQRTEATARNAVAAAYHGLGDRAEAATHYREALRVAERMGARFEQCEALIGLAGLCEGDTGRAAAITHAHAALALARDRGYRVLEGQALVALAELQAPDDPAAARRGAQAGLAIQRETGYRLGQARALRTLGAVLQRTSGRGAALTPWREAYSLLEAIGSAEANQLLTLIASPALTTVSAP
jgi:DNA-binding SARP family transcriptional activator